MTEPDPVIAAFVDRRCGPVATRQARAIGSAGRRGLDS